MRALEEDGYGWEAGDGHVTGWGGGVAGGNGGARWGTWREPIDALEVSGWRCEVCRKFLLCAVLPPGTVGSGTHAWYSAPPWPRCRKEFPADGLNAVGRGRLGERETRKHHSGVSIIVTFFVEKAGIRRVLMPTRGSPLLLSSEI